MTSGPGVARPRCAIPRGLTSILAVLALALVIAWPVPTTARAAPASLVLGTTTTLQASGLLDALLPPFEQQTGYQITPIAVSSGQALALGARGELEVLLVDSPEEERAFMAVGHGVDRRLAFHTEYVMLGPSSDPAGLRAASSVADALRRAATSGAGWVSRGDNSGPFQLERKLWGKAGVEPAGQPWYVELGQGTVPTLAAATERQAYTLADRRTWLEQQSSLDLGVVASGFPELLDLYSVIVVNPAEGPWLDEAGARAFADYMLSSTAQNVVRTFGTDRYGASIFTPDGGRAETELVPSAPR